jgi:hypothetical protein
MWTLAALFLFTLAQTSTSLAAFTFTTSVILTQDAEVSTREAALNAHFQTRKN